MLTDTKSFLFKTWTALAKVFHKTNTHNRSPFFGSLDILSKNLNTVKNLNLNNSIESEKLINDEFYTLKISDTLADAFTLINLQNCCYILLVDEENRFQKTIKSSVILNRFPPPLRNIPRNRRIYHPGFSKSLNRQIMDIAKETLGTLEIEPANLYSYPQETVRFTLSKLAQGKEEIIPILNKDHTISGVVKCIDLLEYFNNNNFLSTFTVDQLYFPEWKPYIDLEADSSLALADYLITYLPIDYIVVADFDKTIKGVLDKNQIARFLNSTYEHLIEVPIGEVINSVAKTYMISTNRDLKSIADIFLNSDSEVVIIGEKADIQLFTPKSLLQSLATIL